MPPSTGRRMSMNPQEFNSEDLSVFHRYFDLRLFLSLGAAMVPVVIPLFIWGIGVENRGVVQQEQLKMQQEQIKMILEDQRRQDQRSNDVVNTLRGDLKDLAQKLDRLIENGHYRPKP